MFTNMNSSLDTTNKIGLKSEHKFITESTQITHSHWLFISKSAQILTKLRLSIFSVYEVITLLAERNFCDQYSVIKSVLNTSLKLNLYKYNFKMKSKLFVHYVTLSVNPMGP